MSERKIIIGLEVHVQLNTKSKIFCSCSTDYNVEPNSHVCEICLGMPGTKPSFNREVFLKAIKAGIALNCKFPSMTFFSRKSYFYPDMSKNFQITQYEIPLSKDGFMIVNSNGKEKKIRIRRMHIEEDPAKLIHESKDISSSKYTLVDYNRAGIPLIEIVTEPDFNSLEEVKDFFGKLTSILEHLGIYDSDKFVMKADVNVNVEGAKRVEVKNVTGIKSIERVINFEVMRQNTMLNQGMILEQETRHFDEAGGTTKKLRTKETEAGYGYIFEPNLVWYDISSELINKIKKQMPELPAERIEKFIKKYKIEKEIAYSLVYVDKNLADFFEECTKSVKDTVFLANFTSTDLLKSLNFEKTKIKNSKINSKNYTELIKMTETGKITPRLAKEIIKQMVKTGKPAKSFLSKGFKVITSVKESDKIIVKIIKSNKKAVEDYTHGNEKALDFLVGISLKESNFKLKPDEIREKLKEILSKNS